MLNWDGCKHCQRSTTDQEHRGYLTGAARQPNEFEQIYITSEPHRGHKSSCIWYTFTQSKLFEDPRGASLTRSTQMGIAPNERENIMITKQQFIEGLRAGLARLHDGLTASAASQAVRCFDAGAPKISRVPPPAFKVQKTKHTLTGVVHFRQYSLIVAR